MKMDSPHWHHMEGVCVLHSVPSLPCPACLAGDGHEDLEFRPEEMDFVYLEGENFSREQKARNRGEIDDKGKPVFKKATLADLVPANIQNPRFM